KTPEQARLIRTAREVNDDKPQWVLDKVSKAVARFLSANPDRTAKEVSIACFGLAFKPDIDDLRESPALAVAKQLITQHPGKVLLVEPNITRLPAGLKGGILLDTEHALRQADISLYLVAHKEFKSMIEGNSIEFFIDAVGLMTKEVSL